MRSASTAFAAAVAGSHQIAVRVDVIADGTVIAEDIPIVSGRVTFDRRAERLARLDVTVADPVRIPEDADDVLTPFGYELAVWRGVELPDGPELLPLGVFPIQRSDVDGVTLLSEISTVDRSQLVADARFEDDYQIAAGTNYAAAIEALIADGVSGLTYLFPSIGHVTPLLTFAAQEDRWVAAQSMARSCGMEILFDGLGRCVMRPEPAFTGTPVATIAEGVNMTGVGLSLDRQGAYNRVIAIGRNASTGDQFSGVATDDNPASPTYYFGRFRKRSRFYFSEFLASAAQAASAASAILTANLGVARAVDFAAIPDPRLECSDVVVMRNTVLDIDELHIIETLSIGLGPEDTMTGTTRSQQVAA